MVKQIKSLNVKTEKELLKKPILIYFSEIKKGFRRKPFIKP
jgi:hypothetical protein